MFSSQTGFALILLVLSALFPRVSSAYTIQFATGPITLGSGLPDNAEADIQMDAANHQLYITLLNKQLDPKGITSAISGVEIDFNNLSAAATATIASTTVSTFTINSDGSITGLSTQNSSAWLAETNASDAGAGYASNTIALCVVCKNVNGTSPPTQLVIGGPAANKPLPYGYSDGNNSITNNHSPYILGSGSTFAYASGTPLAGADTTPTWVLNVPQLQVNTTIAKVRFYFGSAYLVPTQEADATIETAPEPDSVIMILSGLFLIAVSVWRRRKVRQE
jgi:hypothetical protein